MGEERNLNVRLPHRGVQEESQAAKSNLSMLHAGSNKGPVFCHLTANPNEDPGFTSKRHFMTFPDDKEHLSLRTLAHTRVHGLVPES